MRITIDSRLCENGRWQKKLTECSSKASATDIIRQIVDDFIVLYGAKLSISVQPPTDMMPGSISLTNGEVTRLVMTEQKG